MLKQRLIAVLLLATGAGIGYWNYTSERAETREGLGGMKVRLGLDIQGGAALLYKADTSKVAAKDVPEAMNALRGIIEHRVNPSGNVEATVSTEMVTLSNGETEHRLNVEIPGVVDLKQTIDSIGKAPLLEFKTPKANFDEIAKDKEGFYKMVQEFGTSTEESSALKAAMAKYPLALEDPFETTSLNGSKLDHAESQMDQQGNPQVLLIFNSEGQKLFGEMTKANEGKPIAIYLDNKVISQPTVREAILDGKAVISGGFSPAEVRELSRNLNSGAVPMPVTLLSTEQVGATLGADVLHAGIRAGIIAIALVSFFLIFWYRLPGLLAVLAMGVYIALMLGLIKIIPITLTAAGIAAFLLSIGMAVDANILMFERMKEELRDGKRLEDAITHGFDRAWTSIRDSNVSTLITAAILFWFGSSVIRGFALLLGLGVLVSMFTAVTVSRTFLKSVAGTGHMSRFKKALFGMGINFN